MSNKHDRARSPEQEIQVLQLGATIGQANAQRELGISKSYFTTLIKRHPKEWSDARAARGDSDVFRKQFAAKLEDLAENYTMAEELAIERATELLEGKGEKLDAKETAALIKAMGSSRGAAAANARAARGEPDKSFDLNINFPALEAAAERLLAHAPTPPAIEGSAEEIEGD